MSETLRVNPIACTGRAVCAELLPELIAMDPWGYPIVPVSYTHLTLPTTPYV